MLIFAFWISLFYFVRWALLMYLVQYQTHRNRLFGHRLYTLIDIDSGLLDVAQNGGMRHHYPTQSHLRIVVVVVHVHCSGRWCLHRYLAYS